MVTQAIVQICYSLVLLCVCKPDLSAMMQHCMAISQQVQLGWACLAKHVLDRPSRPS